MIQAYRKKAGITQEELANRIGVARTTITAIEKGERAVKAEELLKFSEILGVRISDLQPDRRIISSSTLQFRNITKFNANDDSFQDKLLYFQKLCENYCYLLTKYNRITNSNIEYNRAGLSVGDAAKGISVKERMRLGLGNSPLPLLRDYLEREAELVIFFLELPSEVSGAYFFEENFGGFILVNKNHPEERRRMTICHEYGHYLADRRWTSVDTDEIYKKVEAESFASLFAIEFLLPSDGIAEFFQRTRQANGKFTSLNIMELSNYYGASFQATAERLESLNFLPGGTYDRIRIGKVSPQKMKEELGFSDLPSHDATLSRKYTSLATRAYRDGNLSEGQISNYLNMDRLETRDFLAMQERKIERGEFDFIDKDLLVS
ncbi:ImmA/IrrE family metallo-endopeptidase [Leptospira alstonii]|uniref:ImmA/IrrE family metallo-endopeptidase n=1 Tax=Leptospira alstonii TaxID=28452 RepID=UPI0038B9A646